MTGAQVPDKVANLLLAEMSLALLFLPTLQPNRELLTFLGPQQGEQVSPSDANSAHLGGDALWHVWHVSGASAMLRFH